MSDGYCVCVSSALTGYSRSVDVSVLVLSIDMSVQLLSYAFVLSIERVLCFHVKIVVVEQFV